MTSEKTTDYYKIIVRSSQSRELSTIIKLSRDHCNDDMRKRTTPMFLSLINYDSACVSLKIPHRLACLTCKSKLDLLS